MKILLTEQQLILLTQQYAAGVLPICRNTGRICLQYRGAKITEPHTWATWGGGMSIGESPKETATREFFEESGVFAPITLIDSFVDIKQSGFKYFNFIGLVNDEFKPLVGKYTVDGDVEIEDYKWVTFDEFKNMVGKKDTHFGINSLYKNAGEQIKEIIGKHCKFIDNITENIKYINFDGFEDEDGYGYDDDDEDEVENNKLTNEQMVSQAYQIAHDTEIRISNSKDLLCVYVENNEVIGAAFYAMDSDDYEFDVVVRKNFQNKGIGLKLVKEVISNYKENLEHSEDMKLKADCVNPNMVSLLSRVGFKVENIFGHHTIMVYK